MGQLYNIQRRVICLAGMRLATLLESAAFPRGWRRSDRLRWDERVPWFLEGRVSILFTFQSFKFPSFHSMQWINRDSFEDRTILILIPNLFFIFHRFNDYWCGLDCLQNIEHPPRRGEQVYSNHNPGPEEQYTAGGFDTPGARRGRDPSRFNFSQRGYWVPFTLRTHGSYSRDKYLLDISLVFEARICREKEREREREIPSERMDHTIYATLNRLELFNAIVLASGNYRTSSSHSLENHFNEYFILTI